MNPFEQLFHALPELYGEKVALRQIDFSDFIPLGQLFTDKTVQEFYYLDEDSKRDINNLFKHFLSAYRNGRELTWVIVSRNGNKIIGFCNIQLLVINRNLAGKIAYVLDKSFRNQGIVTESIALIFKELQKCPFVEFHADISKSNIASQRVMEKLGFEKKTALLDHEFPDRELRFLWKKRLINERDEYFNNAVGAFRSKDFRKAEQLFTESLMYPCLDNSPNNDALILNNRAMCYISLGLKSEALGDLQQCYQLGLRNDIVINHLNRLQRELL